MGKENKKKTSIYKSIKEYSQKSVPINVLRMPLLSAAFFFFLRFFDFFSPDSMFVPMSDAGVGKPETSRLVLSSINLQFHYDRKIFLHQNKCK